MMHLVLASLAVTGGLHSDLREAAVCVAAQFHEKPCSSDDPAEHDDRAECQHEGD